MNTQRKHRSAALRGRGIVVCTAGLIALAMALPATVARADAAAQMGMLDTSFGGGVGFVMTGLSTATGMAIDATAVGVAQQSDGKIVVAGTHGSRFFVIRYDADGAIDPTFGVDGRASIWLDGTPVAHAMTLQPDGKILVVGTARDHSVFAVVRFDSDGTPDPTFGTGGKVTSPLGKGSAQNAEARAVAVSPDGKIVVVGWAYIRRGQDFAVVRYNADGTLDTTFGIGGVARDIFLGWSWANAVAIQPDGEILVAGTNGSQDPQRFTVVRFDADGTLDPSFSGNGKVSAWFGPADGANLEEATVVALQPSGKIVVAGFAHSPYDTAFAMARYLPDGTLDATFGRNGLVQTRDVGGEDFHLSATAMAIDPDGRITLTGGAVLGVPDAFQWSWATARYTAAGRPDHRFSGDGLVLIGWPAAALWRSKWQEPAGVVLESDGDVIVAGTVTTGTRKIAVVKYAPPAFRPDAKLSVGYGYLVGADVYASDPSTQTYYVEAWHRHGETTLLAENDGTSSDRYLINGCHSSPLFSVAYRVGDRSVTRAVVNGTYRTRQLAPGATLRLKVKFVVRSGAPLGATKACVLRVRSAGLGTQQDAVEVFFYVPGLGCWADLPDGIKSPACG